MIKDTRKRSNRDPERIIARLKRDAETDTHAAALLGSIEAGDIKPYRTKKRPESLLTGPCLLLPLLNYT